MWQQIAMGIIGFTGGMVAAGGIVALMIGLGITPRFAGITHTADKILIYEDATMLGAVVGNVVELYQFQMPFGQWGLAAYGIFSGIYLGGWILALAEMVDIFPIALRRLKLTWGVPYIIMSVAIAKTLGSLIFFYNGF